MGAGPQSRRKALFIARTIRPQNQILFHQKFAQVFRASRLQTAKGLRIFDSPMNQ
jgi:hypothetical protein